MSTRVRPRHGSLQYWPRKRAKKAIPRVNWKHLKNNGTESDSVLGIVGYKVGMTTAIIKDDTPHSISKGKRRRIPVTVLEVPKMKVFAVRLYKNGKVVRDIIVSNDKELKRRLKIPKDVKKLDDVKSEDFDNIRIIVYPVLKDMFKKRPDLAEVAIQAGDKLAFVKGIVGKEIGLGEFMKGDLVDVRGLTKGKGFQGPVKRFGITLRTRKSEKGIRKVGSIGPWHPARVSFRVPMAGQLGKFTRVAYNSKIVGFGNVNEEGKNINPKIGWKGYGLIHGDYLILNGSVQGPRKRQLLLTPPLRPNKKQTKRKFEFVEVAI